MSKNNLWKIGAIFFTFLANAAYGSSTFFNKYGFYFGLSVIKDTAYYDFKRIEKSAELSFTDQDRFDWNGSGFAGEMYLGYGGVFLNHYYLALEGFGSLSSNAGNITFFDTNTLFRRRFKGRFEQQWQSGIAILPGFYLMEKGLLYGRIGWIAGNIHLGGNISQTGVIGSFAGTFSLPQTQNGVQFGTGMELELTKNLNVRAEWDWNRFQTIVFNTTGSDSNGHSYVTVRSAFKPTLEQFKLGLNWRFC